MFSLRNSVKYNLKDKHSEPDGGRNPRLGSEGSFSTRGEGSQRPTFLPLSGKQCSSQDFSLSAQWRDQTALANQHIPGWSVLLGILTSSGKRGYSRPCPGMDSWSILSSRHLCRPWQLQNSVAQGDSELWNTSWVRKLWAGSFPMLSISGVALDPEPNLSDGVLSSVQ